LTKVGDSDATPERRNFGVSIGICVVTQSDADFEAMYRSADEALYKAKSSGRNRYIVADAAAIAV